MFSKSIFFLLSNFQTRECSLQNQKIFFKLKKVSFRFLQYFSNQNFIFKLKKIFSAGLSKKVVQQMTVQQFLKPVCKRSNIGKLSLFIARMWIHFLSSITAQRICCTRLGQSSSFNMFPVLTVNTEVWPPKIWSRFI